MVWFRDEDKTGRLDFEDGDLQAAYLLSWPEWSVGCQEVVAGVGGRCLSQEGLEKVTRWL